MISNNSKQMNVICIKTKTKVQSRDYVPVSLRKTFHRRKRINHKPSTPLTTNQTPRLSQLCFMNDWEAVRQRLKSHPHESIIEDNESQTPLHHALYWNPPFDIIQCLINVAPSISTRCDATGQSPLIIACRHRSSDGVVRLLAQAEKQGRQKRRRLSSQHDATIITPQPQDSSTTLWTPLHHACFAGASIGVLQSLVDYDGGAASRRVDDYGRTPLELLWTTLQKTSTCTIRRRLFEDIDDDNGDRKDWKKVEILLSAMIHWNDEGMSVNSCNRSCYDKTVNSCNRSCNDYGTVTGSDALIHAAAVACGRYRVPVDVFQQVLERSNNPKNHDDLIRHLLLAAESGFIVGGAKKAAASPSFSRIINEILNENVASVRRSYDDGRRFPLHVAATCLSGWDRGVKNLFEAYPRANGTRDAATGLYPFMIAAVSGFVTDDDVAERLARREKVRAGRYWEFMNVFERREAVEEVKRDSEVRCVEVIYRLLLEGPELVRGGVIRCGDVGGNDGGMG